MRTIQPFFTQLFDLFLIQLSNWRWSWRATAFSGIIAPLFSIVAFGALSTDNMVGYVLTGNMVFALLLEGLNKVSNHFAFMRINGSLDYFATLPIYRSALILATVFAFLLLSLPSVLTTLFAGALILHIPLTLSPMLIIVIPLISVTLSGLGAMVGVIARTPDENSHISMLLTFILFGFGPVLIPLERLPAFMSWLSLLSPTTYAASALRQVVLNQPDRIPLAVNLLVLSLTAAGFIWLVTQRMDWRAK